MQFRLLLSCLAGSIATRAVTMSAVARDSPENDGRGSRHTPLPSAAERLVGWGAALFSDSALIGRGGAGPPLTLPLQPCPREQQHTAWPLGMLTVCLLTLAVDGEKESATNPAFSNYYCPTQPGQKLWHFKWGFDLTTEDLAHFINNTVIYLWHASPFSLKYWDKTFAPCCPALGHKEARANRTGLVNKSNRYAY